jgi:predicted HAD superfamily phosphohydrolase YqeG
MVGDQYFTDIAGANLAGIRSIKVPTVGRAQFPFVVRWFQRLETALSVILFARGRR